MSAKCECESVGDYILDNLRRGHTQSCGCFLKDKALNTKVGSKIYNTWAHMLDRCRNPRNRAYKDYGGRGIKVCERWFKFSNFYQDMGDQLFSLQLDRIDNNKGYFKENCRWVTSRRNSQNTRVAKWWFIEGVRYNSSTEAAQILGITARTVQAWCQGQTVRGEFYPPKSDCYSEVKYG